MEQGPLTANIDNNWIQQISRHAGAATSLDKRARLGTIMARRMPELFRHLAAVQTENDWQAMREPVLQFLPHTADGGLLIVDFFSQWYAWLCRWQERERQCTHKGVQAYNVALYVLIHTGDRDRARRWARVALIEDVLRQDPEALAAWLLRALLHEPQEEIDKLVKFVQEKQREDAGDVPQSVVWYPDQVLAEYTATKRPIRTAECDLFEPNLHSLAQLLTNVNKDTNVADKGRALEDMAINLFASVNGFEVRSVRERTKPAQHDVVVRNLVTVDPVVAEFGPYLLIECKNWTRRAGARVIRDLVSRVRSLSGHCGVLLSAKGVTGMTKEERVDADLEIVKAFHRDNVYILVLKKKHLCDIVAGNENLLKLMVEEYEKIKFDRKTRWSETAAQSQGSRSRRRNAAAEGGS